MTVIKNKKTLLDYISQNFNKNDNKIISTGYKSNLIIKYFAGKNINYVRNKNFLNTNMVESLMLCKKKLKRGDLIVVYSDIYFDKKIIKKIKKLKGNIIAVNANWLKSWRQRYNTLKKMKEDAEDLIVSKGKIKSIGNKIGKKLPKFQYMGILKIKTSVQRRAPRSARLHTHSPGAAAAEACSWRRDAMAVWPCSRAMASGVVPHLSSVVMSSPGSVSRRRTISRCP